jgi:hypothetical protein
MDVIDDVKISNFRLAAGMTIYDHPVKRRWLVSGVEPLIDV